MPRTIYKYPLTLQRSQVVTLPRVHKILTVQAQGQRPMLWAMVNTDSVSEQLRIYCLPTGEEGPPPEWDYIATIQVDWTVWHFFS